MNEDKELDMIFHQIDDMLRVGEYQEVDGVLKRVDVSVVSVVLVIGYLTVTYRYKSVLKERGGLFTRLEDYTKETGIWEEGLLRGLEQ